MNEQVLRDVLVGTRLGEFLNDPKEIERLIKYNDYCIFAPGDVILEQGKMIVGMYVMIEGTALSTAQILGEGGTYIATLSRGNLFGEVSLIEKGPCATSVIASSQVKCLLITNAYYDMLAVLYPETQHKITKAIALEVCLRLIYLHNKIANFMEQTDMASRQKFGEVIKSFAKTAVMKIDELPINKIAIHKNNFFARFNDQEFDELLHHADLIKTPKNCTLIREGDPQPPCYIVIRGAVQSSIFSGKKVAKLLVFGPISIFGSISVIDERSPAVFNYTTCEKCILLRLSLQNIRFLQKNFPRLWFKLFYLICHSLVTIEKAADKLDVRLKSEFYNR